MNKKNYKNKNILIITSIDDTKKIDLLNLNKIDFIYPLNPASNNKKIKDLSIPKISIDEFINDKDQLDICLELEKVENKLEIDINSSEIKLSLKEALINSTHKFLSIFLYFKKITNIEANWYIFINNKWENTNINNEIIEYLYLKLTKYFEYKVFFSNNKLINFFYKNINNFFLKIYQNKKKIFFTGNEENKGFDFLAKSFLKYNSNTVFFKYKPNRNFFRIIINNFKKIFFDSNKILSLIPIKMSNYNYEKELDEICKLSFQTVSNENLYYIKRILVNILFHTNNFDIYSDLIFKKNSFYCLVLNHIYWMHSTALAAVSKKYNVPSFLITHGSHVPNQHDNDIYPSFKRGYGMCFSRLCDYTVIQSKLADNFLNQVKTSNIKIYSKPIMWGLKNNVTNYYYNSNKKFTILHAGTFKFCGSRLWIYETSNEYFLGLKKLINYVKKYDNIELIIRGSENFEFNFDALNESLVDVHNVKISNTGTFTENLLNSDLLISFSSTTIEEALYYRKPVAIFGGTNRYIHAKASKISPNNNKRFAVYNLLNNNFDDMINNIVEFHKSSPLKDDELNDYIFIDEEYDNTNFCKKLIKYIEN